MEELEVQQRARVFISDVDVSNIHNDLGPYLAKANALVKKEELGVGESGYVLTRRDGKHVITVNSLEVEQRQRFTICHEIAHIVLALESSHDVVPPWAYAKREPNEIACDSFAAELLMPYKQWLAAVPGDEPSLELIQMMADKFKASFPAAASRYASLSNLPCAFITMEDGYIRYAIRSMSLRKIGAWIPIKTVIPEGSISFSIRSAGKTATAMGEVAQDIWIDNGDAGSDLKEIAKHFKSSDTTIALIWFDAEDLPEIEIDRFGRKVDDDGGLQELTGELTWKGKRK